MTKMTKMTTNTMRAQWAGKAVDTFTKITELEGEEMDTILSDLLCNLNHLADQHEVDFNECLKRAQRNYETETS
jgi:uncharacterized protein YukE